MWATTSLQPHAYEYADKRRGSTLEILEPSAGHILDETRLALYREALGRDEQIRI
jgi:hypothetical protein